MQGKRHKPTEASRAVVRALSGYGIPTEQIAAHPDVKVSRSTLWKHYAEELAEGNATALGKLGEELFKRALGGSDAILIFLGKTRLGLKEVTRTEQTGADGGPIKYEESPRAEIESRLAGLRVVGGTDTDIG